MTTRAWGGGAVLPWEQLPTANCCVLFFEVWLDSISAYPVMNPGGTVVLVKPVRAGGLAIFGCVRLSVVLAG